MNSLKAMSHAGRALRQAGGGRCSNVASKSRNTAGGGEMRLMNRDVTEKAKSSQMAASAKTQKHGSPTSNSMSSCLTFVVWSKINTERQSGRRKRTS